jgi:hypothetical protein
MDAGVWALLIASCAVLTVVAAIFFADRLWMPTPHASGYWSLAFVTVVLCAVAYLVGYATGYAPWTIAIADGAMVLTVGVVWTGARRINGGRGGLPLVLGTVAAVAATALVGSDLASQYVTATALTVTSALAARETARGELRRLSPSRLLPVVFALHAVYTGGKVLMLLVVGERAPVMATLWGDAAASAIGTALGAAAGAVLIRILMRMRMRERGATDSSMLRMVAFADAARASGSRVGSVVVVRLDRTAQLRAAFGAPFVNGLTHRLQSVLAETVGPGTPGLRGAAGLAGTLLPPAVDLEGYAADVRTRFDALTADDDLGVALTLTFAVVETGGHHSPVVQAVRLLDETADGVPGHPAPVVTRSRHHGTVGPADPEPARRRDLDPV